jgi:c-di-GMP-binding flagellar brake protein YcgR
MEDSRERRQYKRAIFSLDDNVIGIFSLLNYERKAISANILNLGMGGIHFTVDAAEDLHIERGDRIVLLQIKASLDLQFLLNVDSEVKWILNPPILEHMGVGCAFVNVPESSLEKIDTFVNSWNKYD